MKYIRIDIVYFVFIASGCYDFTIYPRDSGTSGGGGDSSSAISGQPGADVQLDGSPSQGDTSLQRGTEKDASGTTRGGTSGAMVAGSGGDGKQSASAGIATGSGGRPGELSAGSAGSGGVGSSANAGNTTSPGDGCEITAVPDDIRNTYNLDPFYQKYVSANGIVIVTSSKVGDEAIFRNCKILLDLYSKRDDARKSIISQKVFFALIAQSEQFSSIPEINAVYGNQHDARARSMGSMTPTICSEDSIMCMASDPWSGNCICVHEYGHTLSDLALAKADSTWSSRLKTIYNNIQSSGRLENSSALQDGSSGSGLMAWGVQAWYNCATEGTRNGSDSDINTRDELKKELPEFYNLLAEVLPEDNQYKDCYYKQ